MKFGKEYCKNTFAQKFIFNHIKLKGARKIKSFDEYSVLAFQYDLILKFLLISIPKSAGGCRSQCGTGARASIWVLASVRSCRGLPSCVTLRAPFFTKSWVIRKQIPKKNLQLHYQQCNFRALELGEVFLCTRPVTHLQLLSLSLPQAVPHMSQEAALTRVGPAGVGS